MTRSLGRAGLALAAAVLAPALVLAEPRHGIAMYGEPALPPDFVSLPYADPQAPKGGTIVFGETGGFDSLNPYILKGRAPAAIQSHVFETLMARNWDEPFGLYGLLAESIETGPDREWVEFTLRPEATFSDGTPVTVEDVVWSMQTLAEDGLPRYRNAWEKVADVEQTGERSIRFTFAAADSELPLIIGLRPILKKADWEGLDFAASSLRVPVGSGPYTIGAFEPGRFISFERDPGLLGAGPADQPGTEQFRHDPHRVLRRRGGAVPGVHRRRALGVPRDQPVALADRLRLPGGEVGGDRQGRDPARAAVGDGGVRLQPAPAAVRGLAGARRADPCVQLRVRQPDAERRRDAAAGELFLELGAGDGARAGGGAGARAARAVRRQPGAGRARRLCAAGLRRVAAQPGEHAGRAAAARGGGLDGAGRRAEERGRRAVRLRDPAAVGGGARRSPTSMSTRCASSGSTRGCRWSTRRSTTSAGTTTTTT